MSNTQYTDYVLIGEVLQSAIILTAVGISELKPKSPANPPQTPTTQTQAPSSDMKKLIKQISNLEREMSNINITNKLAPTKKGKK